MYVKSRRNVLWHNKKQDYEEVTSNSRYFVCNANENKVKLTKQNQMLEGKLKNLK